MAQIAYVNGRYVHHRDAMVHVEDRGYQFSDGIYEYLAFYNQKILDEALHNRRLERSLKELGMNLPFSMRALSIIMHELIARNGRIHGGLYLQISRGVAKRDHAFPKDLQPSVVMTVCAAKFPKPHEIRDGVKVITQQDQRWARRDIKTVSLLANVLAKQEASKHGAREAWLIEDGHITEGAVSNSYIVTPKGEILTHPANHRILGGITREMVLELARGAGIKVTERPYTMNDVKNAAEAFLTSTSANVLPVVKVDDMVVGSGKPGTVTQKLQALYAKHIFKQTGYEIDQA